MARPGVTYEQALQIFIKLLASGQSLSAQRARELFGSGSNSTWTKHLENFRQQQQEKQLVSLPDTLPDKLIPLIESFWAQSVAAAGEQFVKERDRFHKEREALKKQIDDLRTRNDDLQDANLEFKVQVKNAAEQAKALSITLLEKEDMIGQLTNKLENERQRSQTKEEKVAQLQQELVGQHEKSMQNVQAMESKFQHETRRNEEAEAKWMQLYDNTKLETKKLETHISSLKKQLSEMKDLHRHNETLARENSKLLTMQDSINASLEKTKDSLSQICEERDRLDRGYSQYKLETQGQLRELFDLRVKMNKLQDETMEKDRKIEQLNLELTKLNAERGIQTQLLASIEQLKAS